MSKRYNKDFFKELREKSEKHYSEIPALNWGMTKNGKYVIEDRYDFVWKTEQGPNKRLEKINVNVEEYILEFIRKEKEKQKITKIDREISVFFGTDSQNFLCYTRFVSVIVLYVNGNGAHVLVSRFDLPKMYDYRYRLLKETDITGEVVRNMENFLITNGLKYEIHSDYNRSTNHKSSNVVTEASNYMKHLGYELKIKDQSWAASYCADHLCK